MKLFSPMAAAARSSRPGLAISVVLLMCHLAWSNVAWAHQTGLCSTVSCTGGVPILNFNSGTGRSHAEIVPIFWGTYWNSGNARTQAIGALQALVNSSYLGALSQYGGDTGDTVGPARMVPVDPIYTATTPPTPRCDDGTGPICLVGKGCSDGSHCTLPHSSTTHPVQDTVNSVIGQGLVPGPVQNADMIYVLFVPPNESDEDWNVAGTCTGACGSAYANLPYNLIMALPVSVDNGGLSHELVESIAGNMSATNCGPNPLQMADLCCSNEQQLVGTNNTINVVSYWSQFDEATGGCVIPEGWRNIYQYNPSSDSWMQIMNGGVRQIDAGGFGLIATDTHDNLDLYEGGANGMAWTQIGGPGAMFDVGANQIIALTPDATQVFTYPNPGSNPWKLIGGTPATSVIAGGPFLLATNPNGDLDAYSTSTGTWTDIGGPRDQFAANAAGVVAISLDHLGVWLNANGTAGGFQQIVNSTSASQLFLGVNSGIAETALAASKNVLYYDGAFVPQGGPGNMFAVTANGSLYGLNPARTAIFQSTNTGGSNPSWRQLPELPSGPAVGRIVGHGNQLYATGGVMY